MSARIAPDKSRQEDDLDGKEILPLRLKSKASYRAKRPILRALSSILSFFRSPISLFSLFFVGGSCFFLLPLFLQQDYFSLHDTVLSQSLESPLFRYLLCSLISLPLPLLFELFLDVFETDTQAYSCPRLLLVFVLMIPSIVFLINLSNREMIFLCLYHLQHTSWIGIGAIYLNLIEPQIFTAAVCLSVGGIEMLSALLDIAGYALSMPSLNIGYLVLHHMFYFLATLMAIKYFYTIYQRNKGTIQEMRAFRDIRNLPANDFTGVMIILASTIAIGGSFIIPFITSGGFLLPHNFTVPYLLGYYIVFSVFTVIVTVVPSRLAKALTKNLQNNLEVKRTFVRHVGHEIRTPLNTGKIFHRRVP